MAGSRGDWGNMEAGHERPLGLLLRYCQTFAEHLPCAQLSRRPSPHPPCLCGGTGGCSRGFLVAALGRRGGYLGPPPPHPLLRALFSGREVETVLLLFRRGVVPPTQVLAGGVCQQLHLPPVLAASRVASRCVRPARCLTRLLDICVTGVGAPCCTQAGSKTRCWRPA